MLPASTSELIDSLQDYSDTLAWINHTLDPQDTAPSLNLTELDQRVAHLVSTLEIACEDTSAQLERIIDDVSRGVPRLTYDLHFMKDNALSLQSTLAGVHEKSRDAIPQATTATLDRLQHFDTIKGRMEAAREVLREAESWSTLELEVTSLLGEKSYAKAAERLSEASRSMVVFQNTPEYEPRRTLMVSLQNQLEASLSSALVAAINSQDVAVCRSYFSIFSIIQRESEFRNYYNGSRRASIVAMWQNTRLLDCDAVPADATPQKFTEFLPKFYASFLSLLNLERTSIPAIFPDPPLTLSTLITSILSALQPSFSERLASLFNYYGTSGLREVILAYKATEEFAMGMDKIMEKIKYSAIPVSPSEGVPPDPAQPVKSHSRRRSSRMSMSWRPTANRASLSGPSVAKVTADGLEWDQELFQPFIDLQVDYGSLERRFLDDALREIIASESSTESDSARLLRERSVDIFGVAEESVTRCISFTHGYGVVGLIQALDSFLRSFIDIWTADVSGDRSSSVRHRHAAASSGEDLSDLDYTDQDWSDFQLALHLLASARAVYERMAHFEIKLRSNLVQVATKFRNDAMNLPLVASSSRTDSQLLAQSALNSAELHALLISLEPEMIQSREGFLPTPPTPRHATHPFISGSATPLLVEARAALFGFAKACQVSLQTTILSPLRKHLAAYASLPIWAAESKRTGAASELVVPSFSLSPSDVVQRVAEGLLNLPRLFEVYADDDALSFSLHSLPHIDADALRSLSLSEHVDAPAPSHSHSASIRSRPSLSKAAPMDPEAVSSAWLSSLGQSILAHMVTSVLPNIQRLTTEGAAQLSSDLGYLSNIVRALNVECEELERWKEVAGMEDEEGRRKIRERGDGVDDVLRMVAKMRGWKK